MSDIMGIIYTGEMDTRLRELTAVRAIASVPILARYRVIDFPLSSMVHSGIRDIGVIMQRNYRSMLDHLGSGKEWDLHGKRNGLTILPPFSTKDSVGVYEGMLDALHSNLPYLRSCKEKYGTAGVNAGHDVDGAQFAQLALVVAGEVRVHLVLEQLFIGRIVDDFSGSGNAILLQINISHGSHTSFCNQLRHLLANNSISQASKRVN